MDATSKLQWPRDFSHLHVWWRRCRCVKACGKENKIRGGRGGRSSWRRRRDVFPSEAEARPSMPRLRAVRGSKLASPPFFRFMPTPSMYPTPRTSYHSRRAKRPSRPCENAHVRAHKYLWPYWGHFQLPPTLDGSSMNTYLSAPTSCRIWNLRLVWGD